jgi:hypothetical protein
MATARSDVGSVLRCGICFRNLTLDPARSMHEVFTDGSMRCSAPEALERDPVEAYQSTHVVFDSPMRRVALERAFARGDLKDPTAVES